MTFDVHNKRAMLTILLATCEVTRDAGLELNPETERDVARLIEQTRAELAALGDGTATAHDFSLPPRDSGA
jgi:hypothetical protein